jgi:hypothetical protein
VSVLITGAQVPTEQAPVDDEAPSRLRLDLDEARAEVDHWRARAHEAELAAARAEEQARSAQAVVAAEVAAVQAEVAAKDELVTELRRELEWRRRSWWKKLLGMLLVAVALPSVAMAKERMCWFVVGGRADLEDVTRLCQAGDVMQVVLDDGTGSPVGYASRLCDFDHEIVFFRFPEPTSQTVFACVFTGEVRTIIEVR